MLRAVEKLAADRTTDDTISEKEAAELLGMKVISLRNRTYDGTIAKECYTQPPCGRPVYFKSKLLNIQ